VWQVCGHPVRQSLKLSATRCGCHKFEGRGMARSPATVSGQLTALLPSSGPVVFGRSGSGLSQSGTETELPK